MRKYLFLMLFYGFIFAAGNNANAQSANSLTIDVTSGKSLFTRSISKKLMLRVSKDRSVENADFGWIVEVVVKPYKKSSRNLIYSNETGTTADLSQIYAWQTEENGFPAVREINVRGFPYKVKIQLKDTVTEGIGPGAKFVSGKLEISWTQ